MGCRACFVDLSEIHKKALLTLGTDAQCWDQPFRSAGYDCDELLKQNSTKRNRVYAEMTRKFQMKQRMFIVPNVMGIVGAPSAWGRHYVTATAALPLVAF